MKSLGAHPQILEHVHAMPSAAREDEIAITAPVWCWLIVIFILGIGAGLLIGAGIDAVLGLAIPACSSAR